MNNNCPFCDLQTVKLETVERTLKVKKVDVTSDYKVFICNNCNQEFTTDEIDQFNINNFKEKHNTINHK